MRSFGRALHDGWVVTLRNLVKIKRVPDLIVISTVQPIMFILLFVFVFGGAIPIPGVSYEEYLMGGIFTQTVAFGSAVTAVGLADDLQKGIVDRFRSLPMSRSGVLVGRTTADLINNSIVLVVMIVTGLLVGWRIRSSPADALAGFALLLLFAYGVSWIMAFIALVIPSTEVINNASFMVLFPLTFVANTFVPVENLPGPLRTFAEWNPVSAVTLATRELFGNIPPGTPEPAVWPLRHATLYSLLWIGVFIAVFAPLAVHRYQRAGRR